MPIRRPGIAGSAVVAMAGGQGLRSSRPGLKKPRTTKVGVPGDKGRLGGSHRGEEGGRGSSAAAVCAKEKTADPGDLRLRRLRASSVLGEREDESGEQQGARGKARLLFVAARARGGALPRCCSWAAVAARPGDSGSEPRGEEGGADKRGPGVSGRGGVWAVVAARPFGWAGPRCWAERGREAS